MHTPYGCDRQKVNGARGWQRQADCPGRAPGRNHLMTRNDRFIPEKAIFLMAPDWRSPSIGVAPASDAAFTLPGRRCAGSAFPPSRHPSYHQRHPLARSHHALLATAARS